MGLFDRFKKNKEVKKTPQTLEDVIIQEVNKMKDITPEELEDYRRERAIKKQQYEDKRKIEHKCVENNHKGEIFENEGQIDEAIKCYEENVFLNTISPFTYDRLASLYHYKKDFENERNTLNIFVRQLNEDSRVSEEYKIDYIKRLENVEYYLNNGKWKFDCLPSDPKIIYYDIKEAKTLVHGDEKEKGIEKLEEIMKNGTYNNTVYYTLYQIYNKDKRFDDSRRVCEKAIDVLGFFSNDRLERWSIYLEKTISKQEKMKK